MFKLIINKINKYIFNKGFKYVVENVDEYYIKTDVVMCLINRGTT